MILRNELISKIWIKSFLQINFVLFMLIFSANVISNLLRSNITPSDIALNQLFTTPEIFLKTIPVSCLLTSLILVNKLIKSSELTAMYSLGFSSIDFTSCVLRLAGFASIITILISGFLQPSLLSIKSDNYNFLEKKFRKLKKQGLVTSKIANGKLWYKTGKYFFNYSAFNQEDNTLNKVEIFTIKNKKLKNIKTANYVYINEKAQKRPNTIREIDNIDKNKFLESDIRQDSESFGIPIKKEELKNLEEDILGLNIFQFKKYINQLDKDGVNSSKYEVLFWQKISISLSCLIFAALGLLGLNNSNKRSQTIGASIGVTFIIVLLYWFFDSFLVELGKNSKLNIYLSTFGSLIAAIAVIIMIRVKQIIREF